jgi:hypothetical protein
MERVLPYDLLKRVRWLRDQQAAGRMPAVDLYWCNCGMWTVAVHLTPDIRCSCGETPTYQVTVSADAEQGTLQSARRQTDATGEHESPTPALHNPVSAPHAHGV